MINKLAYNSGVEDAWMTFMKVAAGVPVMNFAKGAKPVVKPPVAHPPGVTVGGAAAPVGAPAPAAAPAAPAAGGGWKGVARDVGVQMAVPLAMMGIQNLMTPSAPKDPNAVG